MAGNILVVDDEMHLRIFLQTALETAGYSVVSAPNGGKGLEKARAMRPDLITLDLMMPGDGGITMYRGLKEDEELKDIPVIVVSAVEAKTFFHSLRLISTAQAAPLPEPDAYMQKPPNPDRLLRLAAELLDRKGN